MNIKELYKAATDAKFKLLNLDKFISMEEMKISINRELGKTHDVYACMESSVTISVPLENRKLNE